MCSLFETNHVAGWFFNFFFFISYYYFQYRCYPIGPKSMVDFHIGHIYGSSNNRTFETRGANCSMDCKSNQNDIYAIILPAYNNCLNTHIILNFQCLLFVLQSIYYIIHTIWKESERKKKKKNNNKNIWPDIVT